MTIKPVSYLQTDARWKNNNYSARGERKTIGSSGCGVTAAAMVIAALKDKNVTPATTAEWSMAHGYKALNQGTYYTYFVPQMSRYGIPCKRLNTVNLYGKSSSPAHTEALQALKNGNWIIACMGKGHWTSSGHYILLYGLKNGTVYINDPASTSPSRTENTWSLFAKQVKYMWSITVPEHLKNNTADSASSDSNYTRKQFITDIQKAVGAKIDGIAGPETLSKTVTVSASKNNRHPVVRAIQKYLNAIGYLCGAPDGIFGARTDIALKSYQAKIVGMKKPDGEITKAGNTWKSLLGIK